MKRQEVRSLEEKSLEWINDASRWAVWPILPLIHLRLTDDNSGIGLAGVLFDEDHTEGYKVYHVNMYQVFSMAPERIQQLTVSKYPTPEALLRDWRVD